MLKQKQPGWAAWPVVMQPKGIGSGLNAALDKIVYLTADGDEELSDLQNDEVYVVGGLVDHNRLKGVCREKGREARVRTARLPLAGNMPLLGSKVPVRAAPGVPDAVLIW